MRTILLLFLALSLHVTLLSQSVGINDTGTSPDQSAMLDVQSSDKGMLIPRMSETSRLGIISPAVGLMVWDTTYNSIWGFDGGQWRELSSKWDRFGDHVQNAYPGNVGIGAYSTGASLYIRKPGASIWLFDEARPATSGTIRGDTNNLNIFAGRILNPFLTDDEPGNLLLQVNQDVGQFGYYGTGNVGIGHENPLYKLTLSGEMGFYTGSSFYGRIYENAENMVVNAGFGSILGSPSDDLLLQTNTSGSIFTYPGNVGIGVTTPLAKLHVSSTLMIGSGSPAFGYALSVNGKVMAEEMRIEDQGSWPDYVFDEIYRLTPLDELQKQIHTLGHLPGIPNAETVESDGLMVGDMQRRQMEKIEELTLYILELHDRIKVLENQPCQSKAH